ncbi:MAG TPA: histidine kinase dimerization/phospho-acceptor domain-containing protein [Luteolibacter sp.]|nr:histidine kinase dimerization/phospho-acceptor domain-containing protein [Luteolibacter sp.]
MSKPRTDVAHGMALQIPAGLAAAIAHELNQPLAAILGNAQAARRFIGARDIDRDELLAILDDIISDTKRAGGMIRNLQTQGKEPQRQGP